MTSMKILYISSLNTAKEKYDGERIKSSLIYDSLSKIANLDIINLSINKIINTIKIFIVSLFKKNKYQLAIISKDPHGANIIHKILKIAKFPSTKIIYFEIGPFLYDRVLNGSIKKETFFNDRLIVVETLSMKKELNSIGLNNVDVFPNFKPIYNIKFNKQKYPKQTLKLVYLSRVEEMKGIYDLIDCLVKLNADKILFTLDVYGRPQNNIDDEKINDLSNKYDFVNYLGTIEVKEIGCYEKLSKYDLHVFPTKYREGFPGTLIDFFIAGVPTLSSSFARANEILSDNDSIIYKQSDISDLIKKLEYIYNNQQVLVKLRLNTFEKRKEYSVERFESYLNSLLIDIKE